MTSVLQCENERPMHLPCRHLGLLLQRARRRRQQEEQLPEDLL